MDDTTRKTQSLEHRWARSYLDGSNAPYLESLYESYLRDPKSVDAHWQQYFAQLTGPQGPAAEAIHSDIRARFRARARHHIPRGAVPQVTTGPSADKQVRVLQLINAYRFRGHQVADFDPLRAREIPRIPDLDPLHHGLGDADMNTVFDTGSLVGPQRMKLGDILEALRRIYCGTVGHEYMHLTDTNEKRWLQQRIEGVRTVPDPDTRSRLLERAIAAETLERYLHTRYAGKKRFSLEGGEGLIPLLDQLIQYSGKYGIDELLIGMAHRGRLNVLTNIMGKKPSDLFAEFEDRQVASTDRSGDVKYHMGFSTDIDARGHPVHVVLAFNPSHLEVVAPVVEGTARARQERRGDATGDAVVPILIHGDAAFAGQGVVMETINMSQSRGYSTKGTIHIVTNNQIGFTTSNQKDARSTLYCTDVAKMVNAPIFHVNGDDPDATLWVTQLALDYRMAFHKDVVIDLVCYRRHGHSEADEPSVTQPMMYQRIKAHDSLPVIYGRRLAEDGIVSSDEADALREHYWSQLDTGNTVALDIDEDGWKKNGFSSNWRAYVDGNCMAEVDTTLTPETIKRLMKNATRIPRGFRLHPSARRVMDNRRKMSVGALGFDWGFAETLAYASLIKRGYNVRLSGQDSGRGTFFHRHAVVYNQDTGEPFVPLRRLAKHEDQFLVINSLLSEEAVLGFEYGYATADPETLTIWEAQFGDFANNAQVVIDQFISAGEQKWNRLCGLTLFLPHGYEGQGPEHSSARLERYLQLCAQMNMQVCVPSNAGQMFHLLRRQMMRPCRKPLIVMTPKSLLRLPQATCHLDVITDGRFHTVLDDSESPDPQKVTRVILCSGRVYYDLLDYRQKLGVEDTAIIRIEQLYPFPQKRLTGAIQRYPFAGTFVWCQEEPKNQGAWYTSQHHFRTAIGDRGYLEYAGRPLSAAPAVGNLSLHNKQLRQLLASAFGRQPEKED